MTSSASFVATNASGAAPIRRPSVRVSERYSRSGRPPRTRPSWSATRSSQGRGSSAASSTRRFLPGPRFARPTCPIPRFRSRGRKTTRRGVRPSRGTTSRSPTGRRIRMRCSPPHRICRHAGSTPTPPGRGWTSTMATVSVSMVSALSAKLIIWVVCGSPSREAHRLRTACR